MTKRNFICISFLAAAILTVPMLGSYLEAGESGTGEERPVLDAVLYGGTGGGVRILEGQMIPRLDFAGGWCWKPWLSLGSYLTVSPLSNFTDADLGISLAEEPNAYALAWGMEVLVTPFSDRILHPQVRLRTGSLTAGYGIDTDGTPESLEAVQDEQFFSVGLSAGGELNLGRHLRLFLLGGYRYAANGEIMGIEREGLSGWSAELGLRSVWRHQIR